MAYRLDRDDKSLEAAFRRIAGEQFGRAIEAVEQMDRPDTIHEVRRHCKRLRGLVRIVRTAFPGFETADEAIRDIARPLSGLRDARVMLDTFDRLVERCGDKGEWHRLAKLRKRLEHERDKLLGKVDAAERLDEARTKLADARIRCAEWELTGDGWEVVGAGVVLTYEKARTAAAEAFAQRQPDMFHELRKQVRYHWCHTRLLRNFWPDEMHARAALADELADMLGNKHDLDLFVVHLHEEAASLGGSAQLSAVRRLAGLANAELEEGSERLAGRLLAETADALAEHWRMLWNNWHDPGFPLSGRA